MEKPAGCGSAILLIIEPIGGIGTHVYAIFKIPLLKRGSWDLALFVQVESRTHFTVASCESYHQSHVSQLWHLSIMGSFWTLKSRQL